MFQGANIASENMGVVNCVIDKGKIVSSNL